MTYYDILGVPTTATKGEIKEAYLKLAKEFHPDKSAGVNPAVKKLVEEKFKDIQEAFEILSKHRAEYDNHLRAVAPPPPPPRAPQQTYNPPTPPRRSVSKNKNNIWYLCGKFVGTFPWHAWVVFGVVSLFIIALIADSSSTQTKQTPTPVTQASSTSVVAKSDTAQVKSSPVNPTSVESSGKFTGQFGGIVHNQSSNSSAEFGIVILDTGGILSGCMGVRQPLFGSGPLSGHATGTDMSFVVTSAIGKITFAGRKVTDNISGTYKVEHVERPTEVGTFTLAKIKSKGPGVDIQNCPTDAEVHQQLKETNSSQTKLEKDISSTVWKHPGVASPEKNKVWIEKDHLYESSEPWSFPNSENIAHSIYCDTVKGATAKLGPAGLYSGECTYTLKWIKEAVTCVITTTETIATITPTAIVGWSQRVDSSPLTHTPATCPIAGADGAAFSLEPNVPMTSAVREVKDTLTRTATVGGYGSGIYKRCHFNVGVYPCGVLENSEVAQLVKGDKIILVSSKIRAANGNDIYQVKFQQWTGWMSTSGLTDIVETTVPESKLYCWLVVTKEHTGMYPTASATDSTNLIAIGTRVYPIKASGGRILIADIHGNNMGVQTTIMKGEWINAANLDCDDKGK
jgi:hypothetical protein